MVFGPENKEDDEGRSRASGRMTRLRPPQIGSHHPEQVSENMRLSDQEL
jgi:hypothetical protein